MTTIGTPSSQAMMPFMGFSFRCGDMAAGPSVTPRPPWRHRQRGRWQIPAMPRRRRQKSAAVQHRGRGVLRGACKGLMLHKNSSACGCIRGFRRGFVRSVARILRPQRGKISPPDCAAAGASAGVFSRDVAYVDGILMAEGGFAYLWHGFGRCCCFRSASFW